MSSIANPYASPQASDLDAGNEPAEISAKFFAISGRLGRMRFVTYGLISAILIMMVGGIAAAVLIPLNPVFSAAIYMAILLASMIYGISLYVRRLHDLGRSGWWSLLMMTPLLNLVLLIYVLFFPGTKGINQHGPRVKPNSTGVIVAFLLSLILAVAYLGVIFAVAIPAYQGYVERAQQAG